MPRPNAVTSFATILVLATACEAVIGTVDVTIPEPQSPEQPSGSETGRTPPVPRVDAGRPPAPGVTPVGVPEGNGVVDLLPRPPEAGQPSAADAGPVDRGPDAAPPPPPPPPPRVPRPVVVEGLAALLERIGVEGGSPRLGRCDGGVIIGVRPTANPGEGVFGERLTFVEPICGRASNDPSSGSISVLRDESLLVWDDTEPFQGVPTTEVPDDRLLWVTQPETLCSEEAPVLVGLSGEYDPVAPDAADSAVIRSLVIECAPLLAAPDGIDVSAADSGHQFISRADTFGVNGTESYISFCEGGSVTTQLILHSGYWLDGFVLGCSRLRSPNLGGEPCSDSSDCQSGTCAVDGTCSAQ